MNNGKFKRELGVTLRYPTYREGLRTLFEGGAVATDKILPGRQRIQAGAATIARRAAIDVKWTLFLGFTYFLWASQGIVSAMRLSLQRATIRRPLNRPSARKPRAMMVLLVTE